MTRFTTAAAFALGLPALCLPLFSLPALAHDSHTAPAGHATRPADLGIQIHDAYAFSALPNAPTAAAFMMIHNHGTEDDHLISVSSDVAERTEIHDHIMSPEGVAQMVHVAEGFDITGYDGELLMQRGGAHVMFMGLKQPFTDGMVFPLTLHFEKAGDVVVDVAVDLARMTQTPSGAGEHGAHMDHSAHASPAAAHGADGAAHGAHDGEDPAHGADAPVAAPAH